MNEAGLARHHRLHGVQPVWPVPDVDAAADWLRDTLGFAIDFAVGEPTQHARVKIGDRSWGDPIYIHLSRSEAAVQPCAETRLHVGHDIDGLFAKVQASGATILMAPTNQPWGLREFVVVAPGGHRLRLGAEAEPQAAHASPRTVIVNYRPKPGRAADLLALVCSHVPALRALGLATDQAPYVMRAADGSIVEVFSWSSAAAIEQAHGDPDVQAMWQRFAEVCTIAAPGQLPEVAQMFAEFDAL